MIVSGTKGRRLGASAEELAGKPYARFYQPEMKPLSPAVLATLAHGPVAAPLLPSRDDADWIARGLGAPPRADGIVPLEDGWALTGDGGMRVAIRTPMAGVTPAMVDWWFGWHSEESARYKLWHPRAHVHAEWRGPAPKSHEHTAGRYVGHVSCVDEYIGSELGRYAIAFVDPHTLGIPRMDLAREVAVCARVGFAELPVDGGWLVHHVRAIEGGGSEMRSRFWLGGAEAGVRGAGPLGGALAAIGRRVRRPTVADGRALLVHCAQEMAHLASFLPALFHALDVEGQRARR
jgi:hypothetical protein